MFKQVNTLRHNQLVKQIRTRLFDSIISSFTTKDFYKGREGSIHLLLADHGEELNEQMQYIDELKKRGFITKYKSFDVIKESMPHYKPSKLENEFDAEEGLDEMNADIDEYNSRIAGETFNGLLVQINSDKFNQYLNDLKNKKESQSSNTVIRKDESGNFYYYGDRIDFTGKAMYYQVLNVLLEHADKNTGFLSSDDIEKYLETEYGHKPAGDKKQTHTRVKNAVSGSQGLFNYAFVKGKKLENKRSDGTELIELKWGKGLIFHNTK